MSSVQCLRLDIANTSLTTADTQQLVAAMVTRVEWVNLVDVTLDMEKLAQYDGEGECGSVMLRGEAWERCRDQVKVWAENMGWETLEDSEDSICIHRS